MASVYSCSSRLCCRFKKDAEERLPFVQPMKTLLPLLLQRQEALIPIDSEESAKLQHWILKILNTTLQVCVCAHVCVCVRVCVCACVHVLCVCAHPLITVILFNPLVNTLLSSDN